MALFSRDNRIYIKQFSYHGTFVTDSSPLANYPMQAVNMQSIMPLPIIARGVIRELEDILSDPHLKEKNIQLFLNNYPEFLMALGYCQAKPHLCLRPDELLSVSEKKIFTPDYILELPGNRGIDILDLKLPSANLLVRDPYLRISHEITKAVAQLKTYEKYFEDKNNRKQFHDRYNLQAFKPELIVVIGRSSQFKNIEERKIIESNMGGIKLFTYDDLISYGISRSVDLSEYNQQCDYC